MHHATVRGCVACAREHRPCMLKVAACTTHMPWCAAATTPKDCRPAYRDRAMLAAAVALRVVHQCVWSLEAGAICRETMIGRQALHRNACLPIATCFLPASLSFCLPTWAWLLAAPLGGSVAQTRSRTSRIWQKPQPVIGGRGSRRGGCGPATCWRAGQRRQKRSGAAAYGPGSCVRACIRALTCVRVHVCIARWHRHGKAYCMDVGYGVFMGLMMPDSSDIAAK